MASERPNPFLGLLRSRKFWLAMLDVFGSLGLYFGVKYANPSLAEDLKFVIGALQPVFVIIIGSIAYEDKAKLEAETERAWRSVPDEAVQ